MGATLKVIGTFEIEPHVKINLKINMLENSGMRSIKKKKLKKCVRSF